MSEAVLKHRKDIQEALYKDFRKHPIEADIGDVYKIITDVKHARAHLAKWMRPKKVATPISQLGSSSYIHHEPKGVVLIISPWNFPFTLTFGPMISAIAAGNCIMLKPSELTPHASAMIRTIVQELFD